MTNQLSTLTPEVNIRNGKAITTSRAVADYFGKMHKHVITKIESLNCSPEFMTANFSSVVVKIIAGFNERNSKAYEMTKDGFVFLVMGFTGKKAAQFKEAYIAEFNRMEAQLISSITELITPKNGRIVTHYQNGTPTYQRIPREDEHIATLKLFLDLARRAKFLVARTEDLENFLLNKYTF